MKVKNSINIFSLKDKLSIVIGGTGKIGRPITEAFLEAGSVVVVCSKNTKNQKMLMNDYKQYNTLFFEKFDQANPKDIIKLSKIILKKYGVPNILVNSSVYRPMKKYLNDSYKKFDESLLFNGRGLFLINREFANMMKTNKKGSIINISSIYGVVAPDPSIYENTKINTEPDYPFTKAGTISMTNYFASYYAKHNIRFNTIIPGGLFNFQNKKFLQKYIKKVPLGRMAEAKDLKGPALFLASNASSYVTGSCIYVDGGYTTL